MKCGLIGKWRIVEADLWDKDFLDLIEPATIVFGDDGHGEIAYGAMTGTLDCEYARNTIFYTWIGSDEGTEVSGSGEADLQTNGTLIIEHRYYHGDEAQLKARKW